MIRTHVTDQMRILQFYIEYVLILLESLYACIGVLIASSESFHQQLVVIQIVTKVKF